MSEPAKKLSTPQPVQPVNQQTGSPQPNVGAALEELQATRRKKWRALTLRLLLGVIAPTAVASVYYGAVDTREYEATAQFTVQSMDEQARAALQGILSTVTPSIGTRDTQILRRYLLSRELFRRLEQKHGFVEHYSQPHVDWFSRLSATASFEEKYQYYRDQVHAEYESESGLVTLRVHAFTHDKAKELSQAVLEAGEQKLNKMMTTARQDRLALAKEEVEQAEQRLASARTQLHELQGQVSQLDPRASAKQALQVKGSLETELAKARAKLNTMQATLQPGTSKLAAQRRKVTALKHQVRQQQEKLASQNDDGLHTDIAKLEPAMRKKEFALRKYESALKSLELARLEVNRKHRYLATVSQPSVPNTPTHPEVWISILTVFVVCCAVVTIGTLILASIREHANL